ncbi:MAG: hypothetical protein IJ491_00965 [Clostridia bacterium]|nr:hypothetical protein [Clostridia bacterium]
MKLGFKSVHPFAAFMFFVFAFLFSAATVHPVTLILSLISAAAYDIKLQGKKAASFLLKFILPLIFLITVFNGIFSHYGATALFSVSGTDFTAEAFLFGFASAMRISALLIWLDCFNEIITSDKFIFLFGRISPRLALIVSMVLRFIPLIRSQAAEIAKAENGIGISPSSTRFTDKMLNGSRRLSVLVSWTLEKGIDTSDSMRARGYGLHGRTSYNCYTFSAGDILIALLSFGAIILSLASGGKFTAAYNPVIEIATPDGFSFILIIFFAATLFMPTVMDLKEEKRWSTS